MEWAGLLSNVLGAAVTGGIAASQNRDANRVVVPNVEHKTSPYALKIMEEANRMKNAAMPGSGEATNQIYQNEANTVGSINRNASSGSQALALIAAAHGQTNDAFNQKQKLENDYHLQAVNNWNNANLNLVSEDDKNYADQVRRQQMAMNEKNNLRTAATTNGGNAMNTFANAFSMYGSGLFGGSGASTFGTPGMKYQQVEPMTYTPTAPHNITPTPQHSPIPSYNIPATNWDWLNTFNGG